jgi:hypothetical protein
LYLRYGGRDSVDAYWAKSLYEEIAEKEGATPHKYAKLACRWYDFKTDKVTMPFTYEYFDSKIEAYP